MIGKYDFTQEEKEAIQNYIHAGDEVEAAAFRETLRYRELLKILGEKADCYYCGNRHWPLCDEEYELDDTDHMP